jgi:hypothetical protein
MDFRISDRFVLSPDRLPAKPRKAAQSRQDRGPAITRDPKRPRLKRPRLKRPRLKRHYLPANNAGK